MSDEMPTVTYHLLCIRNHLLCIRTDLQRLREMALQRELDERARAFDLWLRALAPFPDETESE